MLRCHDLGEADRIITLLTPKYGKVRAVAKGVRRTKSRFGARLEPFSLVDAQFYRGRSLDVITQVESRNQYGRALVSDYEAFTAASAMVETADRLASEEADPDLTAFQLLHGALHAMAAGTHAVDLVMNSYLLRSMAHAGWQLAIFECAICGAPGPHEALNITAGGAVCDDCRPPGSIVPAVATWQLLGALAAGDWKIADTAAHPERRAVGGIVAAFVQWHLERQVKSLRLVGKPAGEIRRRPAAVSA